MSDQRKTTGCERLRLIAVPTVILLLVACDEGDGGGACSVEDTPDGALIKCPDGTQSLVRDGDDGADGSDDSPNDSASCTVEDTADGAVIKCSDGTEVVVNDGVNQSGDSGSQGGSRLTLYTYGGSDGSVYSPLAFYDSVLDVLCYPAMHDDGSIRCLPTSYQATISSYYSDSVCSSELALDIYSSQFTEPPDYGVEMIADNSIGRNEITGTYRYRIYDLGNNHSGSVYVEATDGSCVETSVSLDFYLVGDEIPSSTFVEFTLR